MTIKDSEKEEQYILSICNAVGELFHEDSDIEIGLDDGTLFFTSYIKAGTVLFNMLT